MDIFERISSVEKNKLINDLQARKLFFKKDSTIMTNVGNLNILSVIISGSASIIRIDYNGNKTIIETLNEGDIFASNMYDLNNNELSIISLSDCNVLLFDYENIINKRGSVCHNIFIDNIVKIITNRLNLSYERIQILTKRSIREKILEYFKFVANKKNSKSFKLPVSFVYLADYLAVDRSAMMREIKHLKEEGFIEINNKIVKIIDTR